MFARSRSPATTKLTKVKGHATNEMVQKDEVKFVDKWGNDQADTAADKDSTEEQPKLYRLANMYSKRQKAYQDFMSRIQRYLLKIKEADREKRKEKELIANPFGKKEDCKISVDNLFNYAEGRNIRKFAHAGAKGKRVRKQERPRGLQEHF